MAGANHAYVPAAGRHWLLPLYDPFVSLFTRESRWRSDVLNSLDLNPEDVLVDVGCGTGTLAVMAKKRMPRAEVIGVDPDPEALARAGKKSVRDGAAVSFHQGFGNELAKFITPARATKVVSSLAFHHMAHDMQVQTIAAIRQILVPGGAVRIADFVGGHFHGPDDGQLVRDLSEGGFVNARTISTFRIAFAKVEIVGAETPRT